MLTKEQDAMKKFVWDTSAVINLKEADENGFTPAASLYKDLRDGVIPGPYHHFFPALAIFEVAATISRKEREGKSMLREFYTLDEFSSVYPIDHELVCRAHDKFVCDGFSTLRGADLVFACIAYLENAYLVTKDSDFQRVSHCVNIIDLGDSMDSANYRQTLCDD